MGLGRQIEAVLQVIIALVVLIAGTLVDLLYLLGNVFISIFFSTAGYFMLGSLVLGTIGFAITEFHPDLFHAIDLAYCELYNIRHELFIIVETLAPTMELFLCIFDLVMGFWGVFTSNFISIGLDCFDSNTWGEILLTLGSFALAVADAIFGWLANPFENFITFFSTDPTVRTPWSVFYELLGFIQQAAICQCFGLQQLFVWVINIVRNDNLGCAIDNAINAAIAVFQAALKVLTGQSVVLVGNASEGVTTVLDPVFQRVVDSLVCLGYTVDCVIQGWLGLLLNCDPATYICELYVGIPTTCAPDIGLAKLAARVLTSAVEVVALAANGLIEGYEALLKGGTIDLISLILNARLPDLIHETHEAALAAGYVIANIDSCLAQSVTALVDLVSILIEFLGRVIQQNEWDFSLLFNGVFAIFGNQTYDALGAGSHIIGSLTYQHIDPTPQSGLVCLLSRILTDTACARAFADLTSAVGQLFVVPIFLAEEIFTLDYSSLNFDSNPIASGGRDKLIDTLMTIGCVLTDRWILLLDYTGHFIHCIPGLDGLGTALVTLAGIIDFIVDDIKTFLISTILWIVQGIIWFLSLVGASPFTGRSSGEELGTFFEVFFDWFVQLFDLVLEIIAGFIDYIIFPQFPEIFGQGSLLGTNPGTAKFTTCITEFGDCLCGMTKKMADSICLGALGCLSSWWPDCGDFNPERRRSTLIGGWRNFNSVSYNGTMEYDADGRFIFPGNVFEFYALHFNDTMCGPIFERWADDPPTPDNAPGEADAMEMLRCVSMIYGSAKASSWYNNSDVPPAYFAQPQAIKKTAHHFAKGASITGSVALSNLFLLYSDPAELNDMPEANVTYFNLTAALERNGVNDTVALQALGSVYNGTVNTYQALRASAYATLADESEEQNLPRETVALGFSAASMVNSGVSAGLALIRESRRQSLIGKTTQGIVETTSYFFTDVLKSGRAVKQHNEFYATQGDRRRSVSAHQIQRPTARPKPSPPPPSYPLPPLEDPLYRVQHMLWPTQISDKDVQQHGMNMIYRAAAEYGKHLVGMETINPWRNETGGIIETETSIDNSCAAIRTRCVVDYTDCINTGNQTLGCLLPNATCHGATVYIPTHRICNEFFGSAVVAGICDKNVGQVIAIYKPYQECLNAADGLPVTPPYPIKIVAGFFGVTCFDTGNPTTGSICLSANGCARCPDEQVLPGFDCKLLDRSISDLEWLARRCIDKLGLGPPLPLLPSNITAWFYDIVTLPLSVIMQGNKCGNGKMEINGTITYRNPVTLQIFTFPGEQCDPPYSTGFFINANGTNVSYVCGASCQYAVCGNGVIDPGEQCDDGNNDNGDSCSNSCRGIICGNGIIDAAEECDDGNRISNDGCNRYCEREICPRFHFTYSQTVENIVALGPAYCPQFVPATDVASTVNSTTAQFCWNSGWNAFSMSIDCKAHVPVVEAYSGYGCALSQPALTQILKNCTDQGLLCLDWLFAEPASSPFCGTAVQVGLDFTCSTYCPVCGDGIKEGSEQCDDGTVFPTGNATEDECVQCNLICTCHPDPRAPCSGFCSGGTQNGAYCDPRSTGSPCGAGGTCFPNNCCGDGIQQRLEQCDPNTDPLNASASSTCFGCVISQCACVPGKPCLGICHLNGQRQFRSDFEPVYCDILQDPFACNSYGFTESEFLRDTKMICVPQSCCGNGILEQEESDLALPNVYCEPSQMLPNNNCSDTCNYIDAVTGLQRTPFDRFGPAQYLLSGRRDRCGILPRGWHPGVLYERLFTFTTQADCPNPTLSTLIYPLADCPLSGAATGTCCGPIPNITTVTARLGQCYDQYGFYTVPRTLCNRDEVNSCVNLGFPGSICGAMACCGDYRFDEIAYNIDPDSGGSFATIEKGTPALGCDGLLQGAAGLNSCSGLGTAANCEYGKFFYKFDECTCQPGQPCMGRCTFRDRPTDMLCDPLKPANTPWCNGTDYLCIPIACCGDNTRIEAHGFQGNFSIAGYPVWTNISNTRITLEECDPPFTNNSECTIITTPWFNGFAPSTQTNPVYVGTWADCGILNQTFPYIWTQAEPTNTPGSLDYSNCVGYCTNPTTGIADPSQVCITGGSGNPASADAICTGSGKICRFTACCGNAKLEYPETFECDNLTDARCTQLNIVDSICGLQELLGFRRKRDVVGSFVELPPNNPIYGMIALEDASTHSSNQTLRLHSISARDDPLANFTVQTFDSVLAFFGGSNTGASLFDTLIEWLSRPSTDLWGLPEEQGLKFWLSFELRCKQPIQTTCERGVGALVAIKDIALWAAIAFAVVGLASFFVGGMPTYFLLVAFVFLFLTIFSAHAWYYPFPRCLIVGIVPECLWNELLNIVRYISYRCMPWPHGFLAGIPIDDMHSNATCPEQCGREFNDCKEIGFVNGWDTLHFGLQIWSPGLIDSLRTSLIFPFVQMIPGINTTLAKNFPSCIEAPCEQLDGCTVIADPICEQLENCWHWTFLNIFQLVTVLTLTVLVGLALLVFLFRMIERLAYTLRTIVHLFTEFGEEDEEVKDYI